MRRILMLISLIALSLVAAPSPVGAVFAGDPGRIAFVRPRAECCGRDLYTASLVGGDLKLMLKGDGIYSSMDPAWSPDGRRLLVTKRGLRVMRADGVRVRSLGAGRDGSWSPDGTRIVFVAAENDFEVLVIAKSDGRVLRRPKAARGIGLADPAFSPDGASIVYIDQHDRSWRIRLLDLRSGEVATVATAPEVGSFRGSYESVHWTHDGRLMAIESSGGCSSYFGHITPSCNQDVIELGADGSDPEVVVDGPLDLDNDGFLDYPGDAAPSPDGNFAAVQFRNYSQSSVSPAGQTALWVLDRRDGAWRPLTESTPIPERPSDSETGEPVGASGQVDWQPDCTIYGTRHAEVLIGTPGRDLICGLGGDDVIRGRGGDDVLFGHAGDDRVVGGSGRDIVVGNAGRDRCDQDESDHSRVC